MFFTIRQNGSGGKFFINDDVALYLIIEADGEQEFEERLEEITENYKEYSP